MKCSVCGNEQQFNRFNPIDDHLKLSWQINDGLTELFNIREGSICVHCGANIRAQGLATAIIRSKFGLNAHNLKEWVRLVNKTDLKICELNSCHELHKVLKDLKNLTYAEYGTPTEQDIENLSYADASFDLLLHSETLEHVNSPFEAMNECRRAIKKDGIVLFTTPVVWTRKTRTRAKKDGKKVKKILPASYHGQQTEDYLVFTEFGSDLSDIVKCGIAASFPSVHNFVFYSTKKGNNVITRTKRTKLALLQKYYEKASVRK